MMLPEGKHDVDERRVVLMIVPFTNREKSSPAFPTGQAGRAAVKIGLGRFPSAYEAYEAYRPAYRPKT